MPPQITCPRCGSTINLENRKEVDFEKILHALGKSPRTFTELLTMTNLPRKTLSLRLKELRASGSITKDGGYHLNPSIVSANRTFSKRNGNGKMNPTILHIKKNVQWIPVVLIICLVVVAFGSAMIISPPAPAPAPTAANFYYIPSSNIVTGRDLTFVSASSGPITGYYWNFGDGSPIVNGKMVTHTYVVEGTYTVTLTVRDAHGLTTNTQETVDVFPRSQPVVLPIPGAMVRVDSLPTQYQIGDIITLNITISNVTDLYTWGAGMTFDPTVLACISTPAPSNSFTNGTTALREGSFLRNGGYTLWVPAGVTEDGVIPHHGCTLTGATTPGVSGSGVLATVEFVVIGTGAPNIHLTDVELLNSEGNVIPVLP